MSFSSSPFSSAPFASTPDEILITISTVSTSQVQTVVASGVEQLVTNVITSQVQTVDLVADNRIPLDGVSTIGSIHIEDRRIKEVVKPKQIVLATANIQTKVSNKVNVSVKYIQILKVAVEYNESILIKSASFGESLIKLNAISQDNLLTKVNVSCDYVDVELMEFMSLLEML